MNKRLLSCRWPRTVSEESVARFGQVAALRLQEVETHSDFGQLAHGFHVHRPELVETLLHSRLPGRALRARWNGQLGLGLEPEQEHLLFEAELLLGAADSSPAFELKLLRDETAIR